MNVHLINPRGDALTACGEMAARRDELTTDPAKRTCGPCRITLILRGFCPECLGDELVWGAHRRNMSAAADGRLRVCVVETTFRLGCKQCSKTLTSDVTADVVAAALTESGWRTP